MIVLGIGASLLAMATLAAFSVLLHELDRKPRQVPIF